MAFLIAVGGMTLFVFVGSYFLLRADKKDKKRASHRPA